MREKEQVQVQGREDLAALAMNAKSERERQDKFSSSALARNP